MTDSEQLAGLIYQAIPDHMPPIGSHAVWGISTVAAEVAQQFYADRLHFATKLATDALRDAGIAEQRIAELEAQNEIWDAIVTERDEQIASYERLFGPLESFSLEYMETKINDRLRVEQLTSALEEMLAHSPDLHRNTEHVQRARAALDPSNRDLIQQSGDYATFVRERAKREKGKQ